MTAAKTSEESVGKIRSCKLAVFSFVVGQLCMYSAIVLPLRRWQAEAASRHLGVMLGTYHQDRPSLDYRDIILAGFACVFLVAISTGAIALLWDRLSKYSGDQRSGNRFAAFGILFAVFAFLIMSLRS